MARAAERMQNLLNGLLEYSRVTTQAQPLVPVDLTEIVQGILFDLEVRIEESGGQVLVESCPSSRPTRARCISTSRT